MSDYERGFVEAVKRIAERLDRKPYARLDANGQISWDGRSWDLLAEEVRKLVPKGERLPAYFVDSPTLCTGAAHYIDRFSGRCQCGERSAYLDAKGERGPSAT